MIYEKPNAEFISFESESIMDDLHLGPGFSTDPGFEPLDD